MFVIKDVEKSLRETVNKVSSQTYEVGTLRNFAAETRVATFPSLYLHAGSDSHSLGVEIGCHVPAYFILRKYPRVPTFVPGMVVK
jgi:hypothetical protein